MAISRQTKQHIMGAMRSNFKVNNNMFEKKTFIQREEFDLDEQKERNIFILQVFFALDRGKKNGQVMK